LESKKGTIRYKKAYEIHQEEVKEYAVTRIDEKVADLNAEIARLIIIKDTYLQKSDSVNEIVPEEPKNILEIENQKQTQKKY
jgi:uncharacterized small protein (DUF1192 family)